MHYELALLNSIYDNNDLVTIVESGGEQVFDEYKDVWDWTYEFYSQYGKIPSKAIVKDKFSAFEFVDTTKAPLQYYLDEAKKQSVGKAVRTLLSESIELIKSDSPFAALQHLTSGGNEIYKDVGNLKDTNLVGEYEERVANFRERYENPNYSIPGVPSGLSVIDKIWGGWQEGDFIVMMGIPGCGKTWISRLFAINAWKAGYSPLIISLEMSKQQEGYRLDTILNEGNYFTGTDLMNAKNLSPDEYEEWATKMFKDRPPIHLVTAEGMETANQNMVQAKIDQYKPDLVIVDYFNIMDDAKGGGDETSRIRSLFKDHKRMAVKNSVPIIGISAVTMKSDDYGQRAPELGELAWSKHAAHDADLILAIHREKDSDIFEVVSRKSRRCEGFGMYLNWDLNTGKWEETFDDLKM